VTVTRVAPRVSGDVLWVVDIRPRASGSDGDL
jgi:hypothetical protein